MLNCCESAAAGPRDNLQSLALMLVRDAALPAVVGMREPVSSIDASTFTRAFYSALLAEVDGRRAGTVPADEPLNWARYAVRARTTLLDRYQMPRTEAAESTREWTLPVVYLRPDPFVVTVPPAVVPAEPPAAPAAEQPLGGPAPAPPAAPPPGPPLGGSSPWPPAAPPAEQGPPADQPLGGPPPAPPAVPPPGPHHPRARPTGSAWSPTASPARPTPAETPRPRARPAWRPTCCTACWPGCPRTPRPT